MGKYSSERNNCTLTMAQQELIWKPYYFGVPKNSPYYEEITREYLNINSFSHLLELIDYFYVYS